MMPKNEFDIFPSDYYEVEFKVDLEFNSKALKQLWKAILENDKIKPEDKEPLFEKYTQQMINRCIKDWIK